MLYASIFLVVVGIVLIVYSFFSKAAYATKHVVHEVIGQPPSPRLNDDAAVRDTDTKVTQKVDVGSASKLSSPITGTITGIDRNAGATSVEEPVSPTPVEHEKQKGVTAVRKKEQNALKDVHEQRDLAVLYIDASGVVDYESGKSVIDPTFKKYSKLKRVGSGHVSVVNNGIHFQLRKKLYRFEFYLIEKMIQGENYLAVFLNGSSEVRLFIFKRGSGIEKKLAREYEVYRKSKL